MKTGKIIIFLLIAVASAQLSLSGNDCYAGDKKVAFSLPTTQSVPPDRSYLFQLLKENNERGRHRRFASKLSSSGRGLFCSKE